MTVEPDAAPDPGTDPGTDHGPDPGPDPGTGAPRRWAGPAGVTVVLVLAGLLFATSASTSRGTQLRSERADLADLVSAETLRVEARAQRVASLHQEVERETAQNAVGNSAVLELERRSAALEVAAGVVPVSGPGLVVTLDDAPRDAAVPAQAGPDDLVVHQQDVQAVVNALWSGGADAIMLQDQRVISTSAVRCVGNTLILQGRVYSPPYSITAIGDVAALRAALEASPQISYYLQYVAALRLGWKVQERAKITLPAFAGSLTLQHAVALGDAGRTTPSRSTTPEASTR